MSERYHTLNVVLAGDMRYEEAEALMAAIGQLRGVLRVSGVVADLGTHMAEARARRELADKLWAVLYPKAGIGAT